MPTLNIVMFIKSKWLYCIYQLIQEDVSPTCSKSLLHLKDITCSVATSFYKMNPLSLERWAITMIAMGVFPQINMLCIIIMACAKSHVR